ncbi:fam-a protein, fragment [Plasmodium vinckei petteri]|uniref:Fam-a protein n=1 Tax=Plasmodium vinckei petteri TaxID=138298 RepID=A0A6V7SL55_PLAVN|nr:fam-a protein, fragment [Plasmodium vinckei petteri]CAD2099494.1 fam-a protein, fragment [Plasmodium vinckei petteri]
MNKGYIKTVLFLLSLFAYVTNKALASEQFRWGDSANIFTSRADDIRYIYSNFAIPSNWRVKYIRHLNVPTQSNDNSNFTIPSDCHLETNHNLNVEILRNVSSNGVGPKYTRPNVPTQSNDNSNFTISSNSHLKTNNNLNVAILRNVSSNYTIPSNWRIKPNRSLNKAVIKKFSSIGVSPKDTRPTVSIKSNDNSNITVENIFPRMDDSSNAAILSNDVSNVVGPRINISYNHGLMNTIPLNKNILLEKHLIIFSFIYIFSIVILEGVC